MGKISHVNLDSTDVSPLCFSPWLSRPSSTRTITLCGSAPPQPSSVCSPFPSACGSGSRGPLGACSQCKAITWLPEHLINELWAVLSSCQPKGFWKRNFVITLEGIWRKKNKAKQKENNNNNKTQQKEMKRQCTACMRNAEGFLEDRASPTHHHPQPSVPLPSVTSLPAFLCGKHELQPVCRRNPPSALPAPGSAGTRMPCSTARRWIHS